MTAQTPTPAQLVASIPGQPPRWVTAVLLSLLGLGGLSLIAGVQQDDSTRVWAAFLVNLLFWISIAHFGVMFSTITTISRGAWGRPYLRLAQSMAAFLPLSFVLFIVFIIGGSQLFPWVEQPIPEKAVWLNYPFMAVRDGLGLLVLLILSFVSLFYSLRPDAWWLKDVGGPWRRGLYRILIGSFGNREEEIQHCRKRVAILAPAVAVVYCFVFSLLAGDLIMSLAPHWYSTLFGAYYFVGSISLGLATLASMSWLLRTPLGLDRFITDDHRHDLGKLLFGFCIVSVDFFWSQYLVIWYGNIPEEASFIAARTQHQPWLALSWTVLITCFVGPFILLIRRAGKRSASYLGVVGLLVVVGYWIEKFLLVAPSVSPAFRFGWIELTLTGGFFGLFALSVMGFVRTFPMFPLESDTTGASEP